MANDVLVTEAQAEHLRREREELIRRTICPKGIGEDAFALFIEQCRRSGLDPLLKEAFCVERRTNIGDQQRPNWITKYEFQASEGGFLVRANRFPDFMGVQAQAVYAGDDCEIDQARGEVAHKFRPNKREGALVGAWARVLRKEKLPIVVWLDLAGYSQNNAMWRTKGPTMIEKCARVAALRKAYPEAFTAAYIPEEESEEQAAERAAAMEAHQVEVQVAASKPPPPPAAAKKPAPKAAAELPAQTSVAQLPPPAPEKAAVPASARAAEDAQVEAPAAQPTPEQKAAFATHRAERDGVTGLPPPPAPKPAQAAAPARNGAPDLADVVAGMLETFDPLAKGAMASLDAIKVQARKLEKGPVRNALANRINDFDAIVRGAVKPTPPAAGAR